MKDEINEIVNRFKVSSNSFIYRRFGNGHINDSYLVESKSDEREQYILRKINSKVFKNPEIVVSNSVKVVSHIKEKLLNKGVNNHKNFVLTFIPTLDGNFAFVDENNDFWCLTIFFPKSYTVDFVETEIQAYEAAKAFGEFQQFIADININEFKFVIPDFHNLSKRLVAFNKAVETCSDERKKNALTEIEKVKDFLWIEEKNREIFSDSKIPVRITHNDTKINNVMLDNVTNKAHCVIDLDTVMPGSVLFDFGDMVRTFTSPVAEDEKDIAKVKVRLNIFDALAKGYLEASGKFLTDYEKENLVFGAELIVFEQAIRFLTDYCNNDVYYKTAYREHNLVRARNQFQLLKSISSLSEEMGKIVDKFK